MKQKYSTESITLIIGFISSIFSFSDFDLFSPVILLALSIYDSSSSTVFESVSFLLDIFDELSSSM